MSINLTADDLAKLLAAIQQPIVKEAIDGAKPVKSEPDSTSDSGSKWLVSDVESKISSLEGLLEAKSSETSLLESKVRDLASEVETKSTETLTLDSKVRELEEKFVEASNAKVCFQSDHIYSFFPHFFDVIGWILSYLNKFYFNSCCLLPQLCAICCIKAVDKTNDTLVVVGLGKEGGL